MNFNQAKKLLINIIGDITVMGKPVDVLTEFPPGKHLPAITMNSNGGKGHIETLVYNKMNPLPSDHPYYDSKIPNELYNTGEWIKHVFEGKLLLHVWTESNEERDILMEIIMNKLLQDKDKHFEDDLHVQFRNIGATTDIDQFDSFPPLFHTTTEIDFVYEMIHSRDLYTLCKIEKQEKTE